MTAVVLSDDDDDESKNDNNSHNHNATANSNNKILSSNVLVGRNVLVVGGSGRVGGSVVTQLLRLGDDDDDDNNKCCHVTVGGTSFDSYQKAKCRNAWPTDRVDFQFVDKTNVTTILSVLNNNTTTMTTNSNNTDQQREYDLVVHTAGPFQGATVTTNNNNNNGVLEASIERCVPYVDVCDDYGTAKVVKTKYGPLAEQRNVPCIVSTGCWPGVSSLMAKQLVTKVLSNNGNKSNGSVSSSLTTTTMTPSCNNTNDDHGHVGNNLTVDFSFFTAGSGGAGVTLLVATFLILAEHALTIVDGKRRPVKAMKEYDSVWFGNIVGEKQVANLNLLETASIHDILGVANVKSLFGTAPAFWNALLGLMAQLPPSLLANEDLMRKLAVFSLPIVRLVDSFAGATNAMRCDVSTPNKNVTATAIYAHENLEPCVGECVAAFCAAILTDGVVPAGVWFPEEAISAGADPAAVLKLASIGAHTIRAESKELDIDCREIWGRPQR